MRESSGEPCGTWVLPPLVVSPLIGCLAQPAKWNSVPTCRPRASGHGGSDLVGACRTEPFVMRADPLAIAPMKAIGDRRRGGAISVEPRINDRIRVPEVRLVGPQGEQVGIVRIEDALRLAQESDLDLVEVAPMSKPPVCKLMDYGKFKYEAAVKSREARKNQAHTVIKEMKLRPKIDQHDYDTKKGHVVRFLKAGDKVKITIMFRGREQSRPELGLRLLAKLAEDVQDLGFVEATPKQDGRNMIMVLAPHRTKATQMRSPETVIESIAAEA